MHGPFDSTKLKQLAFSNRLTPHSEVAQSSNGPWLQAGKVKGLFQPVPSATSTTGSNKPLAKQTQVITSAPLVLELDLPLSPAPMLSPAPPVVAVQVNLPASRVSHSLGIGSIVLGTLGFVTCWIPLIGLIGLPLSALGAVLGVVAIASAFFRKSGGLGYPVAGTAISVVAIVVAVSLLSFTAKVINDVGDAAREAAAKATATNQVVVSTEDDAATEPNDTAAGEPSAEANNGKQWAEAGSAVRQGDVEVNILDVTVDFVKIKGVSDTTYNSTDKQLQVSLDVFNVSETKKVTYRTWSKNDFGLESSAELKDNFGNRYMPVTFGLTTKAEGQVTVESLYPGKSVSDLLVFEAPIEKAEYLLLELPANKFGGEGMLRFRIPLKGQDSETKDGETDSSSESAPTEDESSSKASQGHFSPLGDRYRNLPQPAKDVVNGLRELKAATEIGLNITAYKDKIQAVIPPVKLFLESHDAKSLPELAFALDNACDCYLNVRESWSESIFGDSPTAKYVASLTHERTRPVLWNQAAKNLELAYGLVSGHDATCEEAFQSIDAMYDALTMDHALAEVASRVKQKSDSESRKATEQSPPQDSNSTPRPRASRDFDRSNIDIVSLRTVAESLQNNKPSGEAAEALKDFLSLTRSREWVGRSGKKMFGPVVRITPQDVMIETSKGTETVRREHLNPRTGKVAERIMDLSQQVQMLESKAEDKPSAGN